MFRSGTRPSELAKQTTLIVSNEEMNGIMKTVNFLEESGLLIKNTSETIKNEAKEPLHEKIFFRLTKICEKDRKVHIFVRFRMFPFYGNIIFS